MPADRKEEFVVCGEELLRKLRELVREGNIRRILIKDEKGNTFIELPLAIGILGALLVPVWAAVGALAAMASHFTIQVVRRDDAAGEAS
jgi:hypothetical protein